MTIWHLMTNCLTTTALCQSDKCSVTTTVGRQLCDNHCVRTNVFDHYVTTTVVYDQNHPFGLSPKPNLNNWPQLSAETNSNQNCIKLIFRIIFKKCFVLKSLFLFTSARYYESIQIWKPYIFWNFDWFFYTLTWREKDTFKQGTSLVQPLK